MFEHLNFIVNFQDADYSDLVFPENDKQVLRDLGKQVAEIAHRPIMAERRKLWIDHNNLKEPRPVILCDPENGWNEIITDDQITCTNSIARRWECELRKQVFWGDEMNDDYVVEPYFNSEHIFQETPWGVEGVSKHATEFHRVEGGGSYHIDTILDDFETQFEKIEQPVMTIDFDLTEKVHAIAQEIFDGSITPRLKTFWFWATGPTDEYIKLRGMQNMLLDFYDHPDYVHKTMKLIQQWTIGRLEYLEKESLLTLNNDGSYVGSGGQGLTDQLPADDFQGKVRLKDMWALSESQATVGVSNEMFEEFIFQYQLPIMERFGLTCYACCEPMDQRIDIVRRASTLRRVSVSNWAKKDVMSEKLGQDYVYSVKPNPAFISTPEIDESSAREDVRAILAAAKNNRLELVMKDNHTLGKNRENIKAWVKIAREELSRAGY